MTGIASLAEMGALVGEPARTAMLVALMDGRALTAGELALSAGIAPATASGHLGRLVDGRLLRVSAQGRHRYFSLASPDVARMIEAMMAVGGQAEAARCGRRIVTGPRDRDLRRARQCYDHLAGEIAVRIGAFLERAGHLEWSAESAELTASGAGFFRDLGVDLADGLDPGSSARRRRSFCRPCMDWSERRPHLAGEVGRGLLGLLLERDWLRRREGTRALVVTPPGLAAVDRLFGSG